MSRPGMFHSKDRVLGFLIYYQTLLRFAIYILSCALCNTQVVNNYVFNVFLFSSIFYSYVFLQAVILLYFIYIFFYQIYVLLVHHQFDVW